MEPFLLGGHMIRSRRARRTTWGELPAQVRGGNAADGRGRRLGAAIDYLEAVGLDAIEAHEHELVAYALDRLAEIPGDHDLRAAARAPRRHRQLRLEGVHPHDVAQILDLEGVAIRAGHHCCQPLMRGSASSPPTARASTSTRVPEEIDRLVAGLLKVKETFGV